MVKDPKLSIAEIAKQIAVLKADYLTKLKANHSLIEERDDIIWYLLLQSFSTMGRSTGWNGIIGNENNYNLLSYEHLKTLEDDKLRLEHVNQICRSASLRFPNDKTVYILKCFNYIGANFGSLLKVKNGLLSRVGRDEKIEFLKRFPGIGDKYARNMMMDIYHEDFRDSIAIDIRIKSISQSWYLSFENYEEHEKFYLEVAKLACLEGWELDRLMYRYTEIFKKE